MFEHKKISSLDDYFINLNGRQNKSVYFCRINQYSPAIEAFIRKFFEEARRSGVVIEGKIPNPDEKNLAYYNEIMGSDFQMSPGFIDKCLKKWLPRMNEYQRSCVTDAVYTTLDTLRRAGKNENMLKNAYIKFMCWLYYKFERIVNQLGEDRVPKILYEGNISNYELLLVSVLSSAGCDVVLLQYHGDDEYLKLDPSSQKSDVFDVPGGTAFPEQFSLAAIREKMQEELNRERLYGTLPKLSPCTNAWISGKFIEDLEHATNARGEEENFFYNCFIRVNGTEDKITYLNELYQMELALKAAGRKIVVVNGEIPPAANEEIAGILRSNYQKQEQMILDLSRNIQYAANIELQRIMNRAFVDILLDEAKEQNLNKLTNKAVILLCFIKRYQGLLFSNWKQGDVGVFIHMGGCVNENEAMLLRFLAKIPVDVLILCPDRNKKCCLEDDVLYEQNFQESLLVTKFPMESADVSMGTTAYYAERELDSIMYQNSGMYRNFQYSKANSVILQTMYEEINILWNEEVSYRPNFSTVEDIVNIPVIFSKISGVKDGAAGPYWNSIRELITEDTFVISRAPFLDTNTVNPVKAHAASFFKNGKLQRSEIKAHNCYQYGFLREEVQDHILDKTALLIKQKLIKGTFENGTEYTILATALNLPKEILRMIQKMDFTKKNPKLVYVITTESFISLEDSIMVALLSLIGFDILFFVPTGYQSVEKYFNTKIMEEHQIGEYLYDLPVPDLTSAAFRNGQDHRSWYEKIFKRGN